VLREMAAMGMTQTQIGEILHRHKSCGCRGGSRVVKIFKCVEGSQSSMMDIEDEHNRMGTAFGLRYRIG
jgi:hypothetical protein